VKTSLGLQRLAIRPRLFAFRENIY